MELLVVVSIIALLAALILPGLARAREYAYFTSCKSSMRQMSIGFLVFGTDHKGWMPEAQGRCGHPDDSDSEDAGDRRTGGQGLRWMYGHGHAGERLVQKIYDNSSGQRTNGTPDNGWIGKPRLVGKYLPVEALWDPIMKVRPWGLGHNSIAWWSDRENHRDAMTRAKGMFGYYHFVQSVGCWRYQSEGCVRHVLGWRYKTCPHCGSGCSAGWHCHERYRWATKRSPVPLMSQHPSIWLAACHTPMTKWSGVTRDYRSHFGVMRTAPGEWRFNVIHLGGHVHDAAWNEADIAHRWLNGDGFPYGWRGPADTAADGIYGIKKIPDFEGAFDRDRHDR